MKKYIKLGLTGAVALMAFTACNENLLEIPQKGVIAYEDFYKTDEDAESALIAVYAQAADVDGNNGTNQPSLYVLTCDPGDELYAGGNSKTDFISGQEIGEFRGSLTNDNSRIKDVYKAFYKLIYKCNLLIDNFYGDDGSLADSSTKVQCVAEARVLRAWAHFNLAYLFYNPPLVDHVLAGDARPTNCDHDELVNWVISEYQLAIPNLPEREGPNDKLGAVRITKGAAQAFLGKSYVYKASESKSNDDWNSAKTALKSVISSGNYALVPTAQLSDLFHMAGDGNSEKVFEINLGDNENLSKSSLHIHSQKNNALFYRQMKTPLPSKGIQSVGWGNGVSPTQKFVDAMMSHEPNSARRKAWFLSYEEFLTDLDYTTDVKSDGTVMTKEEKLMDEGRGLELKKYQDLYANYGYFWIKFMPYQTDLVHNSSTMTQENRIVMRYAEVLLLYAEACAMTSDGDGLQYLQMIQKRAEAPVSSSLTMADVKREKWFELAWEGQRWKDLVRWGDAPTELAYKCHTETPYLADEFYEYGSNGKKKTGNPHKAYIVYKDDGWAEKGGGYVENHNEYYPIPLSELEINDQLKQNPYWEKSPTQADYN